MGEPQPSRARPPLPALILVGAALLLGGGFYLATRGSSPVTVAPSSSPSNGEAPPAIGASGGTLDRGPSSKVVWSSDVDTDDAATDVDLYGLARFANVTRAVGEKGTILKRGERGGWTADKSGTKEALHAIVMRDGSAIAVGGKGTALRGTDPDRTWTSIATGTTADLYGVALDGADAYAVGSGGTVLRLAKGTAAFVAESVPPETNVDLLGVYASGDGLVIAVGRGGAVLRRGGDGRWLVEPSGTTEDLYAVAGEGKNVRAVGAHGTAIARAESGAWTGAAPPVKESLFAVAARGGTFHAVGAHGTTLRFLGRMGWVVDASGTTDDLYAVAADPALIVASGARGAIVKRAQ